MAVILHILYIYNKAICFEIFRNAFAIIHFNKNINRSNRMKNGVEQLHVVYPKFKNGEAVVRNVKVQQNFGMYTAFS